MASRNYWPLGQLITARIKEFYREPMAIFWVYGFPLLMALALGLAFRAKPREDITIDIVGNGDVKGVAEQFKTDQRFKIVVGVPQDWRRRLQSGKTDLVIEVSGQSSGLAVKFHDQPYRAESQKAAWAASDILLNDSSKPRPSLTHLDEAGSRYIDFFLPGLMGLNLMGGGLWGVGFVLVDMRVRKLLKRFLATPMRRSDFLLAVMISRLLFTVADVVVLLVFGYFVFGVRCQGNYLELMAAVLLGSATFAGIGLLVACRAQTIETISGLMNLVMLPMWICSGVFFASEKFPAGMQPVVNALPLTALNQLLRGIMLDGNSLAAMLPQVAILLAWGTVSFAIALKVFRWR
jgi:ABC-type multidrug transport system permease subunit